ncbi:MAG: S8 family serine peptidase [Defluviitaleaceae bacterium]|nr:S8 family serine peptidase [Defluviitaleaceae bacterium]
MQRNKKAGKRYLAAFLAFIMVLNVFSFSIIADTVSYENGFEEVEMYFDPVAALAVQERISNAATGDFGDLSLVLHTLGESVGVVGFEGEYALPNNQNEFVEIIVQFHTPPTEVLRLMSEANHPYMLITPFGVGDSYEDRALAAHDLFESQIASVPVLTRSQPMILDTAHTLFNGVLMVVPAGMVEAIAALPEVFMVTPNAEVYELNDGGGIFEDLTEFLVELEELFPINDNSGNSGNPGNNGNPGNIEEDDDCKCEYDQECICDDECKCINECEHKCDCIDECECENKCDCVDKCECEQECDCIDECECEDVPNIVTPADPATWTPGSNSWSRGFMRESIDLFELETIWGSGITGQGIRAIIVDSGLDYMHPRFHPYWYDNQRMADGSLGSRVPGSGGNAGVINPVVPPAAGNILPATPGSAHAMNTPQETLWNGGWGDGDNHGTHVGGSIIAMAPGVTFYAYRGLGTGVWGMVNALGRMWADGHAPDGSKYYTRNIVNFSMGNMTPSSMLAATYATNVISLTGYYLVVAGAANNGPDFYTLMVPTDAGLVLTVGGGRAGGWVSPYIFEDARINGVSTRVDLMTWDWAWMPLDSNGWREAFPAEMEGILFDEVFARPILSHTQMQANQVPRWRRGNGLHLDEQGNAEFVWVGALADTDAARNAAFARLNALGVDISGRVIIQARNAAGSPGQNNPRNFWAQHGAGAFVVVDDRPAGTTFSYSGGAGIFDLIQGSIPTFSMPANDGRASLPFPAGFPPQAVISDSPDGSGTIPITTNAATATANITGVTGTINLGNLTDHSVRDGEGNFITQTNLAPNYLATFTSVGPTRHTYNVGVDIVGPATHVHSTWPAQSTNRWIRALRDEAGDFVTAAGDPINWATGNPVRDPEWFNNPHTHRDWSTAYALQMGTSMSGPTVAGIAALVWSAFPDAHPTEVRARIMNTAIRMGSEERGTPYNVFQEGAGFVNPRQSVTQQAFATTRVPMHWHFHPNHDPDLAGQPGGAIVGGGLPGGWQSSSLTVTHSALNFGAVYGTTSPELTVTIHNSGSAPWTHEVNFITADPAVNQRPVGAFHPDVALRLVSSNTEGSTQTFTFVMDFPADAPHGLYNGHVVFTNGAGGRITMPFNGVPYNAEGTVTLREGSGMLSPILASFVRENADQDDPRAVTSNTIGALTNSNRTSFLFNIDAPGADVTGNWYTRLDVYARRVNLETGELEADAFVFGTINQNQNATGLGSAGLFISRHSVTSRVADPANPGQFIDLEEGVYELFIDFNIQPPTVVDMQLVPGQAIPLSVGKFVVTDTRPEVVQDSIEYAGNGHVNITGRILSWAHEMAIEHGVVTVGGQNAAGNIVVIPPTLVGFAPQNLVTDVPVSGGIAGHTGVFELDNVPEETIITAVDGGRLFEFTGATGNAVSQAGALVSEPFEVTIPDLTYTIFQEYWRELVAIRFFLDGELSALPLEDITMVADGVVVEDIRDFTINIVHETAVAVIMVDRHADWHQMTITATAFGQTLTFNLVNNWFGGLSANLVSVRETARNSRQWVVSFNVTQTFQDGRTATFPAEFTLPSPNANLRGAYVFTEGLLAHRTLVFDIRNNGANAATFDLR